MSQGSARERMERFAQEFRNGDIQLALELVDSLLAEHPDQAPLHWQRARVLQSMGRLDEAREAIDRVLEMRPTHAPTWLMRAELVADADSSETALRRAIELDPRLARAHLLLARQLAHDGRADEADAALDQALKHDPHQPEAWTLRGDWNRERAALGVGKVDPGDPDQIAGVAGHRYSRRRLRAARADYETSLGLKNDPRVRLWLALVLQGLGEHEEAIAQYDAVLALTPLDDPGREAIESERACSLDGGRGAQKVLERAYADALALEAEVVAQEAARAAHAQAPEPAEAAPERLAAPPQAPRGIPRAEAFARFGGAEGDERMAFDIAWSLYALGHLPEPAHTPVRLEDFPRYMREHALRTSAALGAHGFRVVGDFEATHLAETLARPTLVRLHAAGDGITCAACYSVRPKWPGVLGFLVLKWKGLWSVPGVVELETVFDDGGIVITWNGGRNAVFGYGGQIDQLTLTADATAAVVLSRHRERVERYRREHPNATAERADNAERIFAIDARIGRAKAAWRRAIGYVDDVEMRQLLAEHYERLAPLVRSKLQQLVDAAG